MEIKTDLENRIEKIKSKMIEFKKAGLKLKREMLHKALKNASFMDNFAFHLRYGGVEKIFVNEMDVAYHGLIKLEKLKESEKDEYEESLNCVFGSPLDDLDDFVNKYKRTIT